MEGDELLRSIATRMNKMTGKGENPNTSSDLSSLNKAQPQTGFRNSDLQEGKYPDILSTMSSADIDAAVNVIETIGKKFQDEVNKAGGTQLSSSPKVSTSSSLVSLSTTINVPRELNSIDVSATFGFPLTTICDLHKLINDIEVGKHEELLSGMTNEDRMETLDALGSICNSILANCNNLPSKASPSVPIMQLVDINTKSSYAGAAGASTIAQPQVNSNFHPLVVDPVFNVVNISIPRKVVKKVSARLEHTFMVTLLERDWHFPLLNIMLETTEADLMDSVTIGILSLTGDDFTRETIRVEYEWRPPRCDECKIFGHVHDHCPKKMANPPIVITSNVVAPTIEKSNDGFQMVGKKKKRKDKSKSTNGGQFTGPSVKQAVRYEPKATTIASKKGATNVSNPSKLSSILKTADTSSKNDNFTTSNSFSVLNDEEDDEEVDNVYDESVNLVPNTNTVRSSSFTAADLQVIRTHHQLSIQVCAITLSSNFVRFARLFDDVPNVEAPVAESDERVGSDIDDDTCMMS
nr:zinc knuckle CX2CX4HX4C [Tanacetum cinerariifolium]